MNRTENAGENDIEKSGYSFLSADGKTQISTKVWKSGTKVRGVVQIVHGMVEFIDRYDAFAGFLAQKGYLVVGCDLLAHGDSVVTKEQWGDLPIGHGMDYIIADLEHIRTVTRADLSDKVPYFILGHSMGSFIVRRYIAERGEGLAGAIICGTAQESSSTYFMGHLMARTIAAFHGSSYRSEFLHNMGDGSYNKRFEPCRTPYDWLSKNEESIDAYAADPRDTFLFTAGGYSELTALLQRISKKETFDSTPADLPLYIIAGAQDPVGSFGKGPQKVAARYRRSGSTDVVCRLYPGDRHEILNELDRDKVYADLLAWLEDHLTDMTTRRGNTTSAEED